MIKTRKLNDRVASATVKNSDKSMTSFRSEEEFEDALIEYLQNIGGTKQWKYEPHIKTEEQLWANFKAILERNNQGKLGKNPHLSPSEFEQVKREILRECRTPYSAGRWIYGINGITQVEITRDSEDNSRIAQDDSETAHKVQDHVYLDVFDQANVGAGNTVYQIVNQIQREPVHARNKKRRFDTTLLINGLPMIHIEEKWDKHDALEGLYQIQQYIDEGVFTGIYSTTQILVGLTPHESRYMANTDSEHFNTDFAFRWQRKEDSKPVWDWREFCDKMLSIPMAHRMATQYMILDGEKERQKLIVMRPYQVYATEKVIEQLRKHVFGTDPQEVGYIWHTTGSGKTISSFKTAWLASRLPNVNKVIFVVDRKALTKQTYDNYHAYDPDATDEGLGIVADTKNTRDLYKKLRSTSSNHNIIVTSIQKLGELASRKRFQPFQKNVVFIVDEAHRSTNGETVELVKKKFPLSAWVGYTGTPVFKGDLTYQVFGNLLHAYTIREAIQDKNVLGFQVDFEHTLSDEEVHEQLLPQLLAEKYPDKAEDEEWIDNKIASLSAEESEELVDSRVYDSNPQHVHAVVENIVKNWKNRSVEGKYGAILTTHVGGNGVSAPMALQYYDEFQKANENLRQVNQKPLNVAVTFSWTTDNSETQLAKNQGLRRAIEDYNHTFGQSFGPETVNEYFDDVMDRLKGEQEKGEKLDIVIVIDQLLTGYDAPKVNTLYVDRLLSGANLIQAYSRTNRIDDNLKKQYGHIVNFRYPRTSKVLMDEAIRVYANRDSAAVQSGLLPEDDGIIAKNFSDVLEETHKIAEQLRELSEDFTLAAPPSEAKQQEAVNLVADYNSKIAALKQYTEYDYDNPEELFSKVGVTKDEHEHIVTVMRNELMRLAKNNTQSHKLDVASLNFEVEHVSDVSVNYDYIDELLAQVINEAHENFPGIDETYSNLIRATDRMDNRQDAERINATAKAAMDGTLKLSEEQYPVTAQDTHGIIEAHRNRTKREAALQFRQKWGLVDVEMASQLLSKILEKHVAGRDDIGMFEEGSDLLNKATNAQYYKTDATDPKIRTLSGVKYKDLLRIAIKDFAEDIAQNYS